MKRNKNNKQTILAFVATVCVVVALFGGCRQRPAQQSGSAATSESKPAATTPAKVSQTNQVPNKAVALHGYKRIQAAATGSTTLPTQLATAQPGKLTAYLGSPSKGIIGVYGGNQTDNPADNIFSVKLDYQPTSNDKVWLTYRLTGVVENSGVACSINDRLAFGGYLVKKDTATKRQRVQLNAQWLQKGENRIQFGLPEKADYGYRVSDLALEVEQGSNDAPVAITTSHRLYNGKAWIHGFVSDDKARVTVDGTEIAVCNGEFETVIAPTDIKQCELKANTKGGVFTKILHWNEEVTADREYALHATPVRTEKAFEKGKLTVLKTPEVTLQAENTGLLATKLLSVTPLRPIDLPALDLGMTNVTADKEGFRFLPHGEHFAQKAATVSLKYDRTKIPDGYTENDIRTFYFDPNTKHWVTLDRDTVDKTLCMVVSKTTHFTDMINGVIKTPESPQTEGFAPTMMNDIKAADPTSKIELIAPPSANSQGSANLSYPIELPPAPNGMNPNLAITYNSDGGSGWLGEGWDLNVPSITVDTRWGVPRYDPNYETETYLFKGMMLATVLAPENSTAQNGTISIGHKGILYDSQYDQKINGCQFLPTIESGFERIIRKGNSKDNVSQNAYFWEITDKNGVKYFYGENNDSRLTGSVKSFSYTKSGTTDGMTIGEKTICSEWKLSRVLDLNGNFQKYVYDKSNLENVDETGTLKSQAIYLKEIQIGRIGLNGENDTIYESILFNNRSDFKNKKDFNAKYGFICSKNKLLNNIVVKINSSDKQVRAYGFKYKQGAFKVDLLEAIIQKDSANNELFSHTLNYYNNISKASDIYSQPSSKISTGDVVKNLPALGGGTSVSTGHSFYAGVGASIIGLVSGDVGYNHSFSKVQTNKYVDMIDINGDNLPDKVFITDDGVYFCPNIGSDHFGTKRKINGINRLSNSESIGTGDGIQANIKTTIGVDANAGFEGGNTFNKTYSYFSDVNNDGLVDFVDNGKVYFNHINSSDIDESGVATPTFDLNSSKTLNPISDVKTTRGTAEAIPSPVPLVRSDINVNKEKAYIYEASPLQDVVRVWEAPYSGNITIEAAVKRIVCDNPIVDSLRVAIQHEDQEIWSQKIAPLDNQYYPVSINRNVIAGQKIYFRLQSGTWLYANGDGDVVDWLPEITYSSNPTSYYDVNNYSSTKYDATDGSIVNKIGYNLVDSGVPITLKGSFYKPVTSDDVKLYVYLSNDPTITKDTTVNGETYKVTVANSNYYSKQRVDSIIYSANQSGNFEIDRSLPYLAGPNHYWFEIYSPTNVCWNNLAWKPELHFQVNDRDTVLYGGVRYAAYTKKLSTGSWTTLINDWEHFDKASIVPNAIFSASAKSINTSFKLAVYKRKNGVVTRIVEKEFNITQNAVKEPSDGYPKTDIDYDADYQTEIYIHDSITTISRIDVSFKRGSTLNWAGTLTDNANPYNFRQRHPDELDFGPMWRNWGQFEYNAANGRCGKEIQQNLLKSPADTSGLRLSNIGMINMVPNFTTKTYWRGLNDNIYINGKYMCSGRLNTENMTPISQISNHNGGGAYNVAPAPITNVSLNSNVSSVYFSDFNQNTSPNPAFEMKNAPVISSTTTNSTRWGGISANIIPKVLSVGKSGSESSGSTFTTSNYMDMNGDGYPDRITEDKIEYTNARGGRDGEISNIDLKSQISTSKATSTGFNGSYSLSGPAEGTEKTASDLSKNAAQLIGSVYENDDNIKGAYMDINGDGLPDKIYEDGSTIKVCFNLGYSFSSAISWGLQKIHSGHNSGASLGIGIGTGLVDVTVKTLTSSLKTVDAVSDKIKLFDFGVDINGAGSTYFNLYELKDINGDGLPDKIFKGTNDKYYVQFNLGGGNFSESESFDVFFVRPDVANVLQEHAMNSSQSLGFSANISAKVNIPVWFLKIVFGGSLHYGRTSDYNLTDINDFNGDGYPDLLASDMGTIQNVFDNTKLTNLNVKTNQIGCTNKLQSISNPIGGTFAIEYDRTVSTFYHPGGKWIMKGLTIDDGDHTDGDVTHQSFEYNDGIYYRNDKEFLGYGTVKTNSLINDLSTSTEKLYRSIVEKYDNKNTYTKDNLLSISTLDADGNKLDEKYSSYYCYSVSRLINQSDTKLNGQYSYTETVLQGESIRVQPYVVYSPLKYTKNSIFTPGNNKELIMTESLLDYWIDPGCHGELHNYQYCNNGKLLSDGEYTYMTQVGYTDTKDPDKYYVYSLPAHVIVQDMQGTKFRETFAVWDVENRPDHLLKVRNIISDGNTPVEAVTEIEGYDYWGNIKKKILPANAAGQRMSYTYEYDPVFHMYPTKVTDAFGYSSTLSDYNYKYGAACRHTDMNGNVTTTKLDDLGRIVSITGPNEQNANKATIEFVYWPNAKSSGSKPMPYAITKHYDPANTVDSTNAIETVTFVDGIGRVIQVKKDGFVNGQEVSLVSGRVKYDAFGRVKVACNPTVEPLANKYVFNAAFDSTTSYLPSTRTSYDILDRVTRTTTPDGNYSTMAYSIESNLLKTTVTDALGNKQESYANGSGKTVKSVQYHNGKALTTYFHYDAIEQVDSVTDPVGKKTISVYDMAGRRTQVTHPATGTTKFSYDAAGNMLWKYTANKDTIRYGYDFGRLVSVTYPRHPENNVKFTFGDKNASNNRVGRLVSQEDGSGAQEFWYGKQGELTKVRRTLIVPNQAVASYATQWQYDSWNRLQKMTYPDGEEISYGYDLGGQLVSVKNKDNYSYVNNITYDKFGDRTQMVYGNGAVTSYTYNDSTRNLKTLSVIGAGSKVFMNNLYAFDRVHNVKSISKLSAIATENGIGGATTHSYGYDDLYRLTSANGTFAGEGTKSATYGMTMDYDDMYNPISKHLTLKQYGIQYNDSLNAGYNLSYTMADNSQQIANIAETSYRTERIANKQETASTHQYSYDANGNLLAVMTGTKQGDKLLATNSRKMLWDEDNHLLAVSDNGFVSNYWYDASGERTVKETGDGEGVNINGTVSAGRTGTGNYTVYVNPYTVINNGGQMSKHIYVGGERILSKLCDAGSMADPTKDTTACAKNYTAKYDSLTGKVKTRFDSLGVAYFGKDNAGTSYYKASSGATTPSLYYYHSDHLGSASLITDGAGHLNQHLAYIPNGEVFVNQCATSFDSRFKFTGKEMDDETGLYYSSQRYLDPKFPGFLSSDELREKHPNIGSYVYCASNPLKYIDPDGRDWFKDKDNSYQYNPNLNKNNASKILTEGQSYAFKSKTLNDKNGTANYRKDGSIMFSNETDAYNRMWSNANGYTAKREFGKKGREEMGVIKSNGVLVLPDWNNNSGEVGGGVIEPGKISPKMETGTYGYDFKDGTFTDPVTGITQSYIATIHTHQDPTLSNFDLSTFAEGGDQSFAFYNTPNKPMVAMGANGNLYGAIYNSTGGGSINAYFNKNNFNLKSILGGRRLSSFLLNFSVNK